MRVGILRRPGAANILMVDTHHIITDGASNRNLIDDFLVLYGGGQLPPLALQYRDYSQWQNSPAREEESAKQQAYWLDLFKDGAPLIDLPADFPRPGVKQYGGKTIPFSLSPDLSADLHNLAAQTGTTLYMLLLAAYNILLAKYTRQQDIIVGSPITGRTHPDLQAVIGLFVNMLVMRNRADETLSFTDFLEQVKINTLAAFDNQEFQFEDLVRKLNLQRKYNRNPLFDTVFQLDNLAGSAGSTQASTAGATDRNLQVSPYAFDAETSQFDMILAVDRTGTEIDMHLTYSTELFRQETAQKYINHFKEILEQITKDKNIPIKDINISHDFVAVKTSTFKETTDDFNF